MDDNECFKWSIVRYLNHADRNAARITKVDKDFSKKMILKKNFPIKIRDNHKNEKKDSISIIYDFHLIIQELGKFNLKIDVITNGLKKDMSFTINNNLSFIDSYQFLRFSLDSLVKNLNKEDFKYLSQEFDNNVLNLVKQKGFCSYEYMSDFEKFKEELPSK